MTIRDTRYARVNVSGDWHDGTFPAWTLRDGSGNLARWNGFADVLMDVYDAAELLSVPGEVLAEVQHEMDAHGDKVPVRLSITCSDVNAESEVREVLAKSFGASVWYVVDMNGYTLSYVTEV